MKPKLAHLECLGYWVTELSVKANLGRDAAAPSCLSFDDVQIDAEAVLDPASGYWRACLSVRQELPPARNAAYSFAISLLGSFRASPDWPAERAEHLVRTNAPSVLYSAAREVLRTAMSAGPYPPIFLPTAWFHVPLPESATGERPRLDAAPLPPEEQVVPKPAKRPATRRRASPGGRPGAQGRG